jgi:hypothetical protein
MQSVLLQHGLLQPDRSMGPRDMDSHFQGRSQLASERLIVCSLMVDA